MSVTRRALLFRSLPAIVAAAAAGCALATLGGDLDMPSMPWPDGGPGARLNARPVPAPAQVPAQGVHRLDLGPGPEVLVHVPDTDRDPAPMRLVLSLHGAGGNARAGLAPLVPLADPHRLLLLAPSSRDRTWDAVVGHWGSDVRRIDQALTQIFAAYPIDTTRVGISGFSDGASYALSLGLANADLFTHIIAFSPGFLPVGPRVGTPQVYIAHGRADPVLPIDATTRRIAPNLRAQGIPTQVREFDGPHIVPADIAEGAIRWFTE